MGMEQLDFYRRYLNKWVHKEPCVKPDDTIKEGKYKVVYDEPWGDLIQWPKKNPYIKSKEDSNV